MYRSSRERSNSYIHGVLHFENRVTQVNEIVVRRLSSDRIDKNEPLAVLHVQISHGGELFLRREKESNVRQTPNATRREPTVPAVSRISLEKSRGVNDTIDRQCVDLQHALLPVDLHLFPIAVFDLEKKRDVLVGRSNGSMTHRWIVFLDEESLNELHGERRFADTTAAEDDDLVFTHSRSYLDREKDLKGNTRQCSVPHSPSHPRHSAVDNQLGIEAAQRMITVVFEKRLHLARK